jgi:membrane-bound serine protease (ClpP class)
LLACAIGWTTGRETVLAGDALAGDAVAPDAAPIVYVAPVDAIIHPISAEFITDAIDTADAHNAAALIIQLETPGGLLESTRTIITRVVAARTPIVVFVGSAAGRAASAGFLITLAADVAVMAPGAHIGAAHPVSGSGEKMDETMAKKAAADVAAYARSLAQARRRNVTLADQAVLESRAFTADEALHAEPPLIDFTASDVNDVIRQLDGRAVSRFDGRQATLHTAGARTETLDMTRRQRFLSAIAHPQIAYILFTIGLLGLTVELWNPGSILPGVAGGLCLLLAFLAFQILPINTAGLLLVLFGVVLLVLELKIPSFGVLGIGGAISLILGSVVMMNRTADIRVDLQLIVPAMVAFAGIFLFLGRLALDSQRRPAVTGADAMIAQMGRAQTAIPAGGTGYVTAHGETWIARARQPIDAGASVRIVALDGLTLTVEPFEAPPGASPPSSPGGPIP